MEIEIYDKRENVIFTVNVEQVSEHTFRMLENSIFNFKISLGTEFETRLNNEGKHVIFRITKESDYIIRRFMLTSQFNESEYQLLGDEIKKHGGHWDVLFSQYAVINLPKDTELDIDEIFRVFGFKPKEIKN